MRLWKLYIYLPLNITCCPHPLLNEAILLGHGLNPEGNCCRNLFPDTNIMYFFQYFNSVFCSFFVNFDQSQWNSSLLLILQNYDCYMFFCIVTVFWYHLCFVMKISKTKKLIQQVICKYKIKSHHSKYILLQSQCAILWKINKSES